MPVLVLVLTLLSGCLGPAPDDDTARQELSSTIARGLADQVALGPDIGADYSGLRAVIVLVDGATVLEQYYGCSRDDAHDLQSVTKSVLATLVGIAVGEGSLRLDDRLATLLPAYAGSMTRATSRATLRQVLTMTAGFPDRFEGLDSEFVHSRDWVREILASADSPPGERFVYANESAHLVSAILEEATGEPVLAYARSRLFEPLGIVTEPASTSAFRPGRLAGYARSGVAWPVDPQGHATGYSWLRLRPTDLARIGQLYLDEGRWDGRQVVPAAWVRAATVNASELPVRSANGRGYGYLWWVRTVQREAAYAALGYGGQVVEVVPSLRLVVVTAVDLDYQDATDQGVSTSLMTSFVESVVAPAVRAAHLT